MARILAGGTIENADVLHPGDVILEVNGVNVITPEDLMHEISQSKSTIQFRIAPTEEVDHTFKPQKVTVFVSKVIRNARLFI